MMPLHQLDFQRSWLAGGALCLCAAIAPLAGCGVRSSVPTGFDVVATSIPGDSIGESVDLKWVRPPDNGELEAWRLAVGDPEVRAIQTSPKPLTMDSLAIVTWNTHVGGGGIYRLVRDLRSGALTDGVPVDRFVLLLQEVYRRGPSIPAEVPTTANSPGGIRTRPQSSHRINIVTVAERLKLGLFYVPSMRNGEDNPPEDRGNAILTTVPFDSLAAIELPLERQRRVALRAQVRGETSAGRDWSIDLLNVHLDARSRTRRVFASLGSGRLRQATFLHSATAESPAAALGGDLNAWVGGRNEGALKYLSEHFGEPTEVPSHSTFKIGPLRRQMDYLLFRIPGDWITRQRVIDDTYGSDHNPLVGWVVFNRSEAEGGL